MKLSLRSKFYLLILPAVVILVLMIVLLMVPFGYIKKDVEQVNEGLNEVIGAENFARNYSRQLRQCSSYIATGLPGHEREYEAAKVEAGIGIADWIKAEHAHKGDPPAEHADELRMLKETQESFNKVSTACDLSVALARDGKRDEAMANFESALDGDPGTTVETNVEDQLPEEEAQLTRYLNNLWGAVNSDPLMRVSGVNSNVESMQEHAANTMFAQQFERNFNNQVEAAFSSTVTGKTDLQEAGDSADQASEALDSWGSHAVQQQGEGSVPLVNGVKKQYKDVSGAIVKTQGMVGSGDTAGALALLESKAGVSSQDSLKAAVEGEVKKQTTALKEDAAVITSSTQWTTVGVALAGGLLILVALVGAFMVSKTVVRPVVDLRDAAKEFGEGGDFKVEVKSRDEIADLAATMNTMAAERVEVEGALRESRDELEVRVEERTRQLADVNEELLQQIEQRGTTEQLLMDEQEFTSNVIDSLTDIFYVLSVEQGGRFIRWNKAFREISGYTDEVLAGMTVLDFFGEAGQQKQLDFLNELMEKGSAQIEAEPVTREGRKIPYLFNSTLVRDENGEPEYVTGVGRDMSAIKAAEERLRTSEEKYRFLADNMEDLAFMMGIDAKPLYISPSVKKLLGYAEDEWLAMTVEQQITPESFDYLFGLLAEELTHDAEREPQRNRILEADFVHKEGHPISFECMVSFIRDESGRPSGIYGLARDITERKFAEQRLRLTQFEIESAMDLIIRVAADGSIAYANAAAGSLLGYKRDELLAISISEVMTNFPAEHWDEIWRVLEDAKLFRFEATAIRKDGEQFPLDASFNFFEFEGEDYMLVFGRDITERRVAEQKQEALNMELVSANKELSDFAYVVSHDLKAPLRGIGSLANWLAADYSQVLDENGRRQLELLLDRAQRMESLIESILQYSRVGRLREEKESVDLNALVPSVVEMLAVPPDIEVIIDELPTVTGEKTRLGQVFQNLIWNAVKFNDRETGGKVEVSCIDMGDTWRFAVEDNGPGIEEKYHERIFGIFQTLQAGDDKESTGVGLTLVKKIVEMHGGRVWLVSKPGEGTTFYFTLPRD